MSSAYSGSHYADSLERDPNQMGLHIPQGNAVDMPHIPPYIHSRLAVMADFFELPKFDDKPVLTIGWNPFRHFFTIRQRQRVAKMDGEGHTLIDSHVVDLVDNNFVAYKIEDARIWDKMDECFFGKAPSDRYKALRAKKAQRKAAIAESDRKMAEATVLEAESTVRRIFDGHSTEAVLGHDKTYSMPSAAPDAGKLAEKQVEMGVESKVFGDRSRRSLNKLAKKTAKKASKRSSRKAASSV